MADAWQAENDATEGLFLHGTAGKSLFISNDQVRIQYHATTLNAKREKAVPIRQITSVEVKAPGALAGYIQFTIAGAIARDSSTSFTGGVFDAVDDENAVLYSSNEDYVKAGRIKEYVEKFNASLQPLASYGPPLDISKEIRSLKNLLDEGLISVEEFETTKRQLLARFR